MKIYAGVRSQCLKGIFPCSKHPQIKEGSDKMKDYLVTGLAHIGIMKKDTKKCANFYVNHLGFHHHYSYKAGELVLEFVENGGCVIEFVQSGKENNAGIVNHIALEVQGIEALVQKLRGEGIVFETE